MEANLPLIVLNGRAVKKVAGVRFREFECDGERAGVDDDLERCDIELVDEPVGQLRAYQAEDRRTRVRKTAGVDVNVLFQDNF